MPNISLPFINISNTSAVNLTMLDIQKAVCVQQVVSTEVINLGVLNVIFLGLIIFMSIHPKLKEKEWKDMLIDIVFMGNLCAVAFQLLIPFL